MQRMLEICNIPDDLINCEQWVCWRLVERAGQPTKIPYKTNGEPASSTDAATWTTFENAVASVHQFDGLGFTFTGTDDYIGIDLDSCRDPSTGILEPWATEVIERIATYTEVSPSQTGVKLFAKSRHPWSHRKKVKLDGEGYNGKSPGIEVYQSGRYFTVTGLQVGDVKDVRYCDDSIEWLAERFKMKREQPSIGGPSQTTQQTTSVLERASKYLATLPPSVSGQNGSDALFYAACRLIKGFELSDADTMRLLTHEFNPRCEPPWSERELIHKVEDARKTEGETGYLLREKQESADKTPKNIQENEVLSQKSKSKTQKTPVPELHEFKPFPTSELPPVLANFIQQGAKAICCDDSFVALPLFAGLASAIGNSYGLMVKRGWIVPSILWCVPVAESGSNKSSPQRLALRPLHERQKKLLREFDAAYAEYEKQNEIYAKELADYKKGKGGDEPPEPPQQPICPRVIVNDVTIEALAKRLQENPRGVICSNDELAGWFSSFNKYKTGKGGDESKWLEFSNAQTSIVDRSSSPRPLVIDKASVSLSGTIQPGILRKHLTAEHKASGMAARLLFAMPPRMQKRWTEDEIDESVENAVAELFDKLFSLEMRVEEDGSLSTNLIRLDSTAKNLFVSFYNRHNREQQQLEGDLFAAFSKLEEYAARFALVIHCVRHAVGDVKTLNTLDVNSMTIGIELCQWFKQEATRVYAVLSESELANENRKLLTWIQNNGGTTTPRDLQRAHRSTLDDSEAAELVLQDFVKAGYGEWEVGGTSDQGGRPIRRFNLTVLGQNPQNPLDSRGSVREEPEEHPRKPR